jgi:hypothetical protein
VGDADNVQIRRLQPVDVHMIVGETDEIIGLALTHR